MQETISDQINVIGIIIQELLRIVTRFWLCK